MYRSKRKADIERQAAPIWKVSCRNNPSRPQTVLRLRRRLEQVDLRGHAVVQDVEHVARHVPLSSAPRM